MSDLPQAIDIGLQAVEVTIGAGAAWAFIATCRRLAPTWLDGWALFVFVVLVSLGTAGWQLYPDTTVAEVGRRWFFVFVACYGGHNGARRLIEYAAKAATLLQIGESIPPPPSPRGPVGGHELKPSYSSREKPVFKGPVAK